MSFALLYQSEVQKRTRERGGHFKDTLSDTLQV